MSGGSFDYMYRRFEEMYAGNMEDIELNQLVVDMAKLLKDLEWYTSGDTCEETYRASVKVFKDKWLGSGDDRVANVKSLMAKRLTELTGEVLR